MTQRLPSSSQAIQIRRLSPVCPTHGCMSLTTKYRSKWGRSFAPFSFFIYDYWVQRNYPPIEQHTNILNVAFQPPSSCSAMFHDAVRACKLECHTLAIDPPGTPSHALLVPQLRVRSAVLSALALYVPSATLPAASTYHSWARVCPLSVCVGCSIAPCVCWRNHPLNVFGLGLQFILYLCFCIVVSLYLCFCIVVLLYLYCCIYTTRILFRNRCVMCFSCMAWSKLLPRHNDVLTKTGIPNL